VWASALTLAFAVAANEAVGFVTNVHYILAVFPVLAVTAGIGIASLPRGRWVVAALWSAVGLWLALFPPPLDSVVFRRYVPWDELLETVAPHADGERLAERHVVHLAVDGEAVLGGRLLGVGDHLPKQEGHGSDPSRRQKPAEVRGSGATRRRPPASAGG